MPQPATIDRGDTRRITGETDAFLDHCHPDLPRRRRASGAPDVHGWPRGEPAEAYDVGIYRDQLAEVERDLARGALPAEEADRVRTEVSRRLLAADAAARASGSAGTRSQGPRLAAAGLALAVALGSLWLYYDLGVPGYGDMPRAGRIADAQEMLRDLPAQAELEANATPSIWSPRDPPRSSSS